MPTVVAQIQLNLEGRRRILGEGWKRLKAVRDRARRVAVSETSGGERVGLKMGTTKLVVFDVKGENVKDKL